MRQTAVLVFLLFFLFAANKKYRVGESIVRSMQVEKYASARMESQKPVSSDEWR